MLRFLPLFACLVLAAQAPPSAGPIEWTHGRCSGCDRAYQLGDIQFVSPSEAWATGFVVSVTGAHVAQYSTVLHTVNAGRTWRPLRDVQTYGVDVEPAFSFVSAQQGWMAWSTLETQHLRRTRDGGRTWTELQVDPQGSWVDLRFFDASRGYATVSTADGPRFGTTEDAGKTWHFVDDPDGAELDYPDVFRFGDGQNGWLGGSLKGSVGKTPRLLTTADGGATWRIATLPADAVGIPHDLSFADREHGWMVLWHESTSTMLRTLDGGQTWNDDPTLTAEMRRLAITHVHFVTRDIGFIFALRLDDGSKRPATGSTMFVTLDSGRNWNRQELSAPVNSCQVFGPELLCVSGLDTLRLHIPR